MRVALIVIGAFAAATALFATAILTQETWAVVGTFFVIGGIAIVVKLAHAHALPRLPRQIRKLGPLPRDPGLRPPPDVSGDPFRT